MKLINKWWAWGACKLGKPATHRELRDGIDYAICNHCNRQTEVHQFGGPTVLPPGN